MNFLPIFLLAFESTAQVRGADPRPLPRGNGVFIAAWEEDDPEEMAYFQLTEQTPVYWYGNVINQTHVSIYREPTAYPEAPNATLNDGKWTMYWDTYRGPNRRSTSPETYILRGGNYTLPRRPKLARMLVSHLTTDQKDCVGLEFYGSTSNWSTIFLETLIKARLKIRDLRFNAFHSKPFKLTEKQLIKAIKTFKPKRFSVKPYCQVSVLSKDFFNLTLVRKFKRLEVNAADLSEVDDKALGKLAATWLNVGYAPNLTLIGIRKFFLRMLNGKVDQDSLIFGIQNVSFAFDGNSLFQGVKHVNVVFEKEAAYLSLWKVTKEKQIFYLQVFASPQNPEKPETTLTLCREDACSSSLLLRK